jgi:hypothetical protein
MSLVLNSSGGGSVTIEEPTTASNFTQTLANANGTLAPIVSGTAITLTNQTAPGFTGLPSWAKRITVMLSGVSTSSTGNPLIQLGDAGGYETTGYAATSTNQSGTVVSYTTAFGINNASASAVMHGVITMVLLAASSNTWAVQGAVSLGAGGGSYYIAGSKSLSDTLTSVRLFIDGTQFFDAGTINIMWE